MNRTNKSKKPPYDAKRAMCVKAIAAEFDVTESYVRSVIQPGDNTEGKAPEIRRAYNAKYQALSQVIA